MCVQSRSICVCAFRTLQPGRVTRVQTRDLCENLFVGTYASLWARDLVYVFTSFGMEPRGGQMVMESLA